MISLKTSEFDYALPPELIAQTPIEPRDSSRLLVINRRYNTLRHQHFYDLPSYLVSGDVLVFNDSRVIRARLFGRRRDSGQKIEVLLLRRVECNLWETLIGSRKKVRQGLEIDIEGGAGISAEVTATAENGVRLVRFSDETGLPGAGLVPLPPYIHTPLADPERYQTIYAKRDGSVAAPTAGLHFTRRLMEEIENKGVRCLFVTLHVGLNTFRPVKTEDISDHPIYPEYGVIGEKEAAEINRAKTEGRRVICVGTTSVRLVESAAHAFTANGSRPGLVTPWEGWVDDFIYPGYRFKVMDALITNFHLPKSTLLMLVSAFAGRELIFRAYEEAIRENYRFYSFGDATIIL
ncbi:MAG: tRNA preQ1(34) S-adenosylmethionine ribosyltransferase-isomerase QueA [Dehalococcoidales bacterium]|nr:tRNA preQ1(34) S-adenosylmethionine ribosyltransferase-isomerase QueA [Dehalococcoidales bacterium]